MTRPVPPAPADETLPDKVETWPHLIRVELLVALVCMILLVVWSIVIDAPLEAPANPNRTPDPSKAPWYFVGLQEILVYFDPWIAGVMVPGFIIVGLMLIPYIDPNPSGNGYYTWRQRRFAISTFLFGFLGLWILPILIGVFCRGPGWAWYWPWQSWEVPHTHLMPSKNLSDLLGVPDGLPAFALGAVAVLGWYALGYVFYRWKRERIRAIGLDGWRYAVVAFLMLSMMAIPLKITLRLALDLKYLWVTPWFNI